MADLREFISTLRARRPRDVLEITRNVSPRHETAAVMTLLERKFRSPLVIFRSIANSKHAVVTNVCGSNDRIALALDCERDHIREVYSKACRNPMAAVEIGDGPVREIVQEGVDVDLTRLPQMVYHEGDVDRPYITAAIVGARDPDSGKVNLSFHRLMVAGRASTGIFMARGKHLDLIHRKYKARGEPMPVFAVLGVHPTFSLGALHTGDLETEEYGVIGALQGGPVELVSSLVKGVPPVPALAEIALEGHVLPDETVSEGPFGEFTGYATGKIKAPVLRLAALSCRRNALFQDIISGQREHLLLPIPAIECHALRVAREVSERVLDVVVVAPMTLAVVIDKSDDDEARRVVRRLLESDVYTKNVIAVDCEVNVRKPGELLSAMSLHTQADRDLSILRHCQGSEIDPSVESLTGTTAKLGIDATMTTSARGRAVRNVVPQEVLDRIDLSELLSPLGPESN
ncbi:MAG: UbiD family decarboxylase domain-containing protein [Planctomycetota bacterium]